MKIQSIHEVQAKLNQIVNQLPTEGSAIITKNGQPCAVLMPVTEDTDLEVVALSQNRRFWKLSDDAVARVGADGLTSLDDL